MGEETAETVSSATNAARERYGLQWNTKSIIELNEHGTDSLRSRITVLELYDSEATLFIHKVRP